MVDQILLGVKRHPLKLPALLAYMVIKEFIGIAKGINAVILVRVSRSPIASGIFGRVLVRLVAGKQFVALFYVNVVEQPLESSSLSVPSGLIC